MRLLHTADLHLGKVLHEQSLLEDQAHVLDQIVAELASGGYDLFVVAGDVFDRSVPPAEAVSLWDSFLQRVAAASSRLQTVVISGNHDGAERLGFASTFLGAQRVHVRTRTDDLDKPLMLTLDGRGWQVFAVPFLNAGSLEVSSASGEPAALRSQRDLWDQTRARLAAARRAGAPALLVAHLFTQGGAESDSERVFVGEAEQVPAAWLEGWDYVALGHLHRAQEPAPGVRYSGSPLATSFSEAGQAKTLVRWDDGQVSLLPLTPLRPLSRLSGTFDELCRGQGYDEVTEHWLEITLTDAVLVPSPLERLRVRFPRLLSLTQAPAAAATTSVPASRRTGNVAQDALRFLAEVGVTPDAATEALLTAAAQEAASETP